MTTASTKSSKLPIFTYGNTRWTSLPRISVPPVEAPSVKVNPMPKPYKTDPNMAAKNKSFVKPMIFAAYVALLMVIIRYIPNTFYEIAGTWIVNDMKGMKIGAIASSIYVFINFIFLYIKSLKNK